MIAFPTPEPPGDIKAQLAAVMDERHPKRAAFVVPEDGGQIPYVLRAEIVRRDEGVLVTTFGPAADIFRQAGTDPDEFDTAMAVILGIPEPKPLLVANCRGRPELYARAVQARDSDGNVVQEAFASGAGLYETVIAIEAHVPPGGELVILSPVGAIARRIAMRWVNN
jgi:hypothetical protein